MKLGYLIRRGDMGHFLQHHKADGSFSFTAAETKHATVFTLDAAEALERQYRASGARVMPDDYRFPVGNSWTWMARVPECDVADLPAESLVA